MAVLLLQSKFISQQGEKPISINNFLNQSNSHNPLAIPRNYASALDSATTFCFLLRHVFKFLQQMWGSLMWISYRRYFLPNQRRYTL